MSSQSKHHSSEPYRQHQADYTNMLLLRAPTVSRWRPYYVVIFVELEAAKVPAGGGRRVLTCSRDRIISGKRLPVAFASPQVSF